MGRVPLVFPLVAIVIGILCAVTWPSINLAWIIVILFAGIIALICKSHVSGIFFLFVALGFSSARINKPPEFTFPGNHTIQANIIQISEASTSGCNAIAEVTELDSRSVKPFKVRLHILSERPYISAGQVIRASVKLKPLQPITTIPDAIDFSKHYRSIGIVCSAEVVRDNMILVKHQPGIFPAMRRAHDALSLKLQSLDISSNAIEMLQAMLLGNKSEVQNDRRTMYSAAGLSHLLALSGMHVAIISFLISCALWPLYVGRHNRTRMILTCLALWVYALLTGFSPSVTRAVIMTSVFLFGRIIERKSVPLNSLCLAAIAILIFSPSDLFNVGFQMSFAAVAGIIIFFPLINRVNRRNHPKLYYFVSFPALSVSAMSLTGIISAFHFHSYPLLFLIANILVVPVVPLFVSFGAVALIFSFVNINLPILNDSISFLCSLIDKIADITASIPFSAINGIYFPLVIAITLLSAFLCLGIGFHKKSMFLRAFSLILLCATLGWYLFVPPKVYADSEIYVIEDYRHKHLIQKQGSNLYLYSSSPIEQERNEYHNLYSEILVDYMALRGIDSLSLMPFGALPFKIVDNDTFVVHLDSCSPPSNIRYRRL